LAKEQEDPSSLAKEQEDPSSPAKEQELEELSSLIKEQGAPLAKKLILVFLLFHRCLFWSKDELFRYCHPIKERLVQYLRPESWLSLIYENLLDLKGTSVWDQLVVFVRALEQLEKILEQLEILVQALEQLEILV
jgi:hypothetical protein